MSMRKVLLRFCSPKYEEERMEHRLQVSMMRAHAENLKREIQQINGHAAEHPVFLGLRLKKP